jgi:hypothetical protein
MALDVMIADFLPENIGTWTYPTNDGKKVPYSNKVAYNSRDGVLNVARWNDEESRKATIEGRFLKREGVELGVAVVEGDNGVLLPIEPPLSVASSGEQPPIACVYPRVVFPAEGEHKYVVVLEFGPKFGTETVSLSGNALFDGDSKFGGHDFGAEISSAVFDVVGSFWPSGSYTVKFTVETRPAVAVRYDGGRPLFAALVPNAVPQELPILDFEFGKLLESFSSKIQIPGIDKIVLPSKKPEQVRLQKHNPRYVEMRILPCDDWDKPLIFMGHAMLEHDGKSDRADLVYRSLRRDESVRKVETNPFLGLVEVDVDVFGTVKDIEVDYVPAASPHDSRPSPAFYSVMRSGGDCYGEAMRSAGFGGDWNSASPVNVGETVLRNPRSGKISPKVKAKRVGHATTFRVVLTNPAT